MKTPADRRQPPLAKFDNCFVRGRGDLVSVRSGRRFDFEADNTLAVLDGSLLTLQGGPKEPPAGATASAKLKRVTACLSEHLLNVKAARDEDRHGPGLLALRVTAHDCLFAAAGGKSSDWTKSRRISASGPVASLRE